MKLSKAQLKRRLSIPLGLIRRIGLKNRDFTIISNNCWGGEIYDYFRLPYKSPTIGLWFPAYDYLKFISNLDFYLKQELIQIDASECHVYELMKKRYKEGRYKDPVEKMVIGRLYDVDIIFLHYQTFSDAKIKWDKRVQRINYNNLIVKNNDQNGFKTEYFYIFDDLDINGEKIFFTSNTSINSVNGSTNVVLLNSEEHHEHVIDDTMLKLLPIDIKKILNNMKR